MGTPFSSANVRFKRFAAAVFGVAAALLQGGCPMFSDRAGCWDHGDCAQGFQCNRSSGLCMRAIDDRTAGCQRPEDCTSGLNCGAEATCVPGDCTFTGCVEGYECNPSSGSWLCETSSEGGAGGAAGEGGSR